MREHKSRRSFFKTVTVGGALLSTSKKAHAKRRRFKIKNPASVDMMEIGIVTCASSSHIKDIWGRIINPPTEKLQDVFWPRQTGIVMTMVWDPNLEEAEAFAKRY